MEYKGEEHHADSALLYVQGCVGACDCAARYYRWDGSVFHLVLRQQSVLSLRCQ
jgi:hypothetical protein